MTDIPSLSNTLAAVAPIVPLDHLASISSEEFDSVKIVYVLVLTGRSWRHFQRMFRLLYHTSNYFYIHVDLVCYLVNFFDDSASLSTTHQHGFRKVTIYTPGAKT